MALGDYLQSEAIKRGCMIFVSSLFFAFKAKVAKETNSYYRFANVKER